MAETIGQRRVAKNTPTKAHKIAERILVSDKESMDTAVKDTITELQLAGQEAVNAKADEEIARLKKKKQISKRLSEDIIKKYTSY